MKIHEYQAKALFREFSIPVPGGDKWIVKAQVHAGTIIADGKGTAAENFEALQAAGVATVNSPSRIGEKMMELLS